MYPKFGLYAFHDHYVGRCAGRNPAFVLVAKFDTLQLDDIVMLTSNDREATQLKVETRAQGRNMP